MRDILSDLDRWVEEGERLAVATVIQTWGSSPRRVGSRMLIASDGQVSGSVSGGCVENAVLEAALVALQTDQARLLHFGVADETAWEVGLACGGSLDVFVKPLDVNFFLSLRATWTDEEAQSVHASVIRGSADLLGREMLIREDGSINGSIGNRWDKRVLELANEILANGKPQRVALDDETEIFLELISPPPTLVAIGGVHITVALMQLAKALGFRTVVVDPRKVWGNPERFPNIDRLLQAWPPEAFQQLKLTRSTAVVSLTHDAKLDDPALKIALNSPAFYIGALGSRTTNVKRRARLLDQGVSESQFSDLYAPVGLDIGAETPEEIALAIMAEVVTAYRKREPRAAAVETDARVEGDL